MTDALTPEKCINYIYQEALSAIYSGVFSPFDTIPRKQLEVLKIRAIKNIQVKKQLLADLKEQVSLATSRLTDQIKEYHNEILKNFDNFGEKLEETRQKNSDKTESELGLLLDGISQENKKTTDQAYSWHIKNRNETLEVLQGLFQDIAGCYSAIEDIVADYSKEVEKAFQIKINLDLSFIQLGNN